MSPTHILMCRKIPNLPRKLDAQNCEFHGKKLRIRWTKLRTNFFAVNLFFTLQHIFACQRNFYRCDLELFRYNLSLPLLVSSCFSALLNHFVWCNSCVKKSVISMISIFFSFSLADTYKSRVRRASLDYSSSEESVPPSVDIDLAQKKIIAEYGPKACVIEEPCKINALRPGRANAQPDWVDILR